MRAWYATAHPTLKMSIFHKHVAGLLKARPTLNFIGKTNFAASHISAVSNDLIVS